MSGKDTATPDLTPITSQEQLRSLLHAGYGLKGPRPDLEVNVTAMERYFARGYEFIPEPLLLAQGYQLVPPSQFTKGLQFAYRVENEQLFKFYRSNYSLIKEGREIPLYLKYEEKH
ncbi:MAG: hypothetical protein ONB25_02695 [candidate division KSB1 bacterium]|nr:hypothetical protein [candidate division KSB1 bacterium]